MRTPLQSAALALALLAVTGVILQPAAAGAAGVSYPSQTVRIIVPFSAGSITDLLSRLLGDKLAKLWGQPVVVEDHPGIAGTALAAKAPADGHTLMVTSNGHTIIKVINPDAPFDPLNDFVGVTKLASMPLILIAPPTADRDTLPKLIARVRDRPGGLSYASAGVASTAYIAAELFNRTAGLRIVHVPYKGSPDAQISIMRGDTEFFFSPAAVSNDLIRAGKVNALAVTGAARIRDLAEVPTFAEAGMPEFQYDAWFGLMAPAATPPEVVRKISTDVAAVMTAPDLQAWLAQQGTTVVTTTSAQFTETMRTDTRVFSAMLAGP